MENTTVISESAKRPCNNYFKYGKCSYHNKCLYSHKITQDFIKSEELTKALKELGLEILPIKKTTEILKKEVSPKINSNVDFPLINVKTPIKMISVSSQTEKNSNEISIQTDKTDKTDTNEISIQTDNDTDNDNDNSNDNDNDNSNDNNSDDNNSDDNNSDDNNSDDLNVKYQNGYNDAIYDITDKILNNFLNQPDTWILMGNNPMIHMYFNSNIKSISNALLL